METKTALVTGATDGIGRQTALELARMGWRVLVHGRSDEKAAATSAQLAAETGNPRIEPVVGDFASLRQVRELAAEVQRRVERLDVLVNNAGVFAKQRQLTEDGYELTFQVNHLAPFLLTTLLRELLARSAPSRIVVVSSMSHQGATLALDDLSASGGFDGYEAYGASKLANLLFVHELARRLEGSGVTVNGLHPGAVGTKMLRSAYSMRGTSVERGAETPVYLASSPDVEGVSGRYFVNRREAQPSPAARDTGLARQLWEVSERAVGAREAEAPGAQP